jgi:hypothetical protein
LPHQAKLHPGVEVELAFELFQFFGQETQLVGQVFYLLFEAFVAGSKGRKF